MRNFRTLKIFIVLPVSIAIFLSVGLGHALGTSRSSTHTINVSDGKNHCHASCLLAIRDQEKKINFQDDDIDPDPLPGAVFNLSFIATTYTVAISSLMLQFLRRRPPDLLAHYCYYRN